MSGARILIVDDDRDLAECLADMLQMHGYDCATAGGCDEALRELGKGAFGLVFLDIRMPGKDGLACFREVRAEHPDQKITMMTGYSEDDALTKAMEEGAYGRLHKPFEMDNVLTMVEAALGSAG